MRRIIVPPAVSASFEMISIPSEPIRELWIKRYHLLEKKLEKLKREWRLFEQDSVQHYQKWYHSTFWDELNRVNDWNEKAREQQRILMAIRAHQQIYKIDEIDAYARVKARLRSKQDAFPDPADIERFEKKQQEREEAERKRREEIRKQREAEAQKFWESDEEADSYAEQIQAAFERIFEGKSELDPEVSEPKASKQQDDLKTLYRAIVRELHPDTGHEMTPLEKEWWNQAQTAYRDGDLEVLKLLALKIQGRGKVSVESITHISTLIELCTVLVAQQDEIETQKRRLKKDPVYRFWTSRTRPQYRDKLTFELKAQLLHQFRKLKEFVSDVKAGLAELDHRMRMEDEPEEENFHPDKRMRTHLGGRGRGRGRGRGK